MLAAAIITAGKDGRFAANLRLVLMILVTGTATSERFAIVLVVNIRRHFAAVTTLTRQFEAHMPVRTGAADEASRRRHRDDLRQQSDQDWNPPGHESLATSVVISSAKAELRMSES
ncbi:MAG TPA: hypothetical protein VK137_05700 [Planctomycetaceae bacterium]|nr:hypothetical protein [Planctomycetaceae bacterium]